ncbi:hypothetical protein [Bilophila sp.]|uniref:hypothetical protein n=1 Tax=Bilophila sp. TaxID=1929485 RepID=UPI0030782D4B
MKVYAGKRFPLAAVYCRRVRSPFSLETESRRHDRQGRRHPLWAGALGARQFIHFSGVFLKGSAIGDVAALSPQYSESTAFLRFSVGGLHGWGLLSVIPLELQEKSINHFLWHGLLKQFSCCFSLLWRHAR